MLKRFVIERRILGIGNFSDTELCTAARAANTALSEIGPSIQWQHSYVADNKTFCVYLAETEQVILDHAEMSGFPADTITEIQQTIDPITGND